MIEICNIRKEKPKFEYDIRVDRASVLGNPFKMSEVPEHVPDNKRRDFVCEAYKELFNYYTSHSDNGNTKTIAFNNELNRLIRIYQRTGHLRLFCWCSPKRCHAETIRDYILKKEGEQ